MLSSKFTLVASIIAAGLCAIYAIWGLDPEVSHSSPSPPDRNTASSGRSNPVHHGAQPDSAPVAQGSMAPPIVKASIYEPADFLLAVYGNPYKAVIDAKTLPAARRDTVYLYVRNRCREVVAQRLSINSATLASSDPTGRRLQALIALESQCQPFFQDAGARDLTAQARRTLSRNKAASSPAQTGAHQLRDAPLDAWADALYVDVDYLKRGGADSKYFLGRLWAGLEGPEQYNRAVTQAMFNLTVSPGVNTPHLETLLLCAQTGSCGVPPTEVAVHDLPDAARTKALAVARAMQAEIASGNFSAFAQPEHQ